MVQAGVDPGFTKWECQPQRGREPIIWPFFPEICMKIKKIERGRGGGVTHPKFYYVDPPLQPTFPPRFHKIPQM